ncbi:uncharacterized protein G2W53_037840 [Senna tora]|uniref:Uncharacterized protein n=1 Tax=Senna tora TaxID=362788 RepID=A0A834SY88_9FABA|nr:uncharacterized protein G2W53_037840 [Senna tora]
MDRVAPQSQESRGILWSINEGGKWKPIRVR